MHPDKKPEISITTVSASECTEPHPLKKAFVQTGLTVTCLSAVMYPIDVIQTRIQTGTVRSSGSGRLSLVSFLATPFLLNAETIRRIWRDPLTAGFMRAQGQCATKTTVITNHETISNRLELSSEEKAHTTEESVSYKSVLSVSGVVAFLDTASTNYFANHRVLNALNKNPQVSGFDKLRFMGLGFKERYGRNYINAACCIGSSTVIRNQMDRVFPQDKYGMTSPVVTTIGSGMVGGFFSNALEVIYKKRIMQVDIHTMSVPSARSVMTCLWKEGGYKVFFRGAGLGAIQTSFAYAIINSVDYFVNEIFYKRGVSPIANNPATLFSVTRTSQAPELSQNIEDQPRSPRGGFE